MKLGISLYFLLSTFLLVAQNDTTVTFKDKWNKFKVKAEEKYDTFKNSIEESSSSDGNVNENKVTRESKATREKKKKNWANVADIPFDQNIVTKNLKDGPHDIYSLTDNKWVKLDFEVKITKELSENGNVNKLIVGGATFERERELDGFDFFELNSHFYCKDRRRYGVYLDDSFIIYNYSRSDDDYSVVDLATYGKSNMNINDLKLMLLKHKQATKDFINNLPPKKYESLIRGSGYEKHNVILAKNGDKLGVINRDLELVIPIEYDRIGEFSEGFSLVKKDNKWFLMDSTLKIWDENKYDNIGNFVDGAAFIKQGNKIGFLDQNLKEHWIFMNNEYSYVRDIGNYYKVKKDGYYGIVSKSKKTILECEYSYIKTGSARANNIVALQKEDGLYGFYKLEYGWITERIYKKAGTTVLSHYENRKEIFTDAMYVEIENSRKTAEDYSYDIRGIVSVDGTIDWKDLLTTAPNNTPTIDVSPMRKKYHFTYNRSLEGHPIIARDTKAQQEGLIDSEGNIVVDLIYTEIEDQYPNYILLEKFEIGSATQTIKIYNVYTGISAPQKIATEDTRLGGAVAYASSFRSTDSGSSSNSNSSNSYSSSTTSNSTSSDNSGPQYKGTITVKNDTGKKLFVWLGSGSGYVNNGNTKLANCSKGVKVYAGSTSGSSSKKFLFEVTPEMCGKTIKLSKYL